MAPDANRYAVGLSFGPGSKFITFRVNVDDSRPGRLGKTVSMFTLSA